MDARDKKIADILRAWDEPYAGNVWKVQGTPVIYHQCLERIAAKAGIRWQPPQCWRAESQDVAILVTGEGRDGRQEWSVGEARVGEGGNYRVSGKQAGYPWAMAEKRGKDRVILKLIDLAGLVYSEEEADEFKQGNADPERTPDQKKEVTAADKIRANLEKHTTWQEVSDFMQTEAVQKALGKMKEGEQVGLRVEAVDRMKALGWTPKPKGDQAAKSEEPSSRQPETIKGDDPQLAYPKQLEAHLAELIKANGAFTDPDALEDAIDAWLADNTEGWDSLAGQVQNGINSIAAKLKQTMK